MSINRIKNSPEKKGVDSSQKNRFSKCQSYTMEDIAFRCDRSRKTIERWTKNGLAPFNPESKPYGFMGDTILKYLQKEKQSRKWDMSNGTYTCFKCGKGVRAKEKSIHRRKRMYHAKCKKCGGNICKTIGKTYTQIRDP